MELEITVEIPKGGFVKRDLAGRVGFVSPLPCPFNYGSLVGSQSSDGDPLDLILLGPRLARQSQRLATVHQVARFIDNGRPDPKLILKNGPPSAFELAEIDAFFAVYARLKQVFYKSRLSREHSLYLGRQPIEAALQDAGLRDAVKARAAGLQDAAKAASQP